MIKFGSSFKAQVATVMTGTGIAQAISLLLMPVLTRIYDPKDFGVFAIFNSFVAIWSLLTTFRVENAVLLPKDDGDARELVALAFCSAVGSSLVFAFLLKVFSAVSVSHAPMLSGIVGQYSFLIALNSAGIAGANILNQWTSRHARFEVSARRVILERTSFILLAIVFSRRQGEGLILGQVFSTVAVLVYMIGAAWGVLNVGHLFSFATHMSVLKRYSGFSLKSGVGSLLQVAAWQVPTILISSWFPLPQVGQYNLATRLLEAPLYLIGNSFSGVFYRKLSISEPMEWKGLLRRALRPLLLVPPIPIIICAILAPRLFQIFFGSNWNEAGIFFAILVGLYWCRLIYIACSPVYLVTYRLGADVIFSLLLLMSQTCALYTGHQVFGTISASLILMTVLTSSVIVLSVLWVNREASLRTVGFGAGRTL